MNKEPVLYVLIGILLMLLFQQQCGKKDPVKSSGIDTVRVVTQMQPVIISVPQTQPVIIKDNPLPTVIDTGAILRAFFAQVEYNDTVRSDTADVYLREFVERNRITARTVGYKVKIPFTTILQDNRKRNEYFVGAFTGGEPFNVGFMGSVKNKKDVLYSLGYDPFKKYVFLSGQIKIR